MTASTESLLEQWGIWKRYGTGVPYYASATRALMRDCVQSDQQTANIEDEEACRVDGVIAKLLQRDNEMGQVLVLYYGRGCSIRTVSVLMKIADTKVRQLRLSGVAWVDAALYVLQAA